MALITWRVCRRCAPTRICRRYGALAFRYKTVFGAITILCLIFVNYKVTYESQAIDALFRDEHAAIPGHATGSSRRHVVPTTPEPIIGNFSFKTWSMKAPIFVRKDHEEHFKTNHKLPINETLSDEYNTMRNIRKFDSVWLNKSHKICGFTTTIEEQDKMYSPCSGPYDYDMAMWLILPDSWSYQHFMDGMMPKIAQLADRYPNITYIIDRGTLKSVTQELDYMGLKYTRKPSKPICVRQAIDACRLAGVNPALWKAMHNLLVRNEDTPKRPRYVVYVPRNINTRNGRHVDNEDAIISYLKNRFAGDLVVFDHTKYSLKGFRQLMLNTRLILGVNGGGLASNLFFVSPYAKTIDFMLYTFYGGANMPYITSSLRGLDYVRVYIHHDASRQNVHIDLNDLRLALNVFEDDAGQKNESSYNSKVKSSPNQLSLNT